MAAVPSTAPMREARGSSPDGKARLRITGGQLETSSDGTAWSKVGEPNGFTRFSWSPDSQYAIVSQVFPGDRKEVFRLASSAGGTRAVLQRSLYDQVGDKLDSCTYWVFNRASSQLTAIKMDPVSCGGYPWAEPPGLDWWFDPITKTNKAIFQHTFRGYQRVQLVELDPVSITARIIIDEQSKTFVDTTQLQAKLLDDGKTILWKSERDMWSHIYAIDRATGNARQITRGPWVVRGIEDVSDKGVIRFTANGMAPGDPYLIRAYKIKMDGTGLTDLTPATGDHKIVVAPGGEYYVDSYSQMNVAPVHELRRIKDGTLVTTLEKADTAEFDAMGVRRPEVFVAKGRDGNTDIWGYICRPNNYDPAKKYPVIEDIYAGPHDSFVPHSYRPSFYQQRMAQLGFIVVQMDGMGTRNRGKQFHDVIWQNLADGGFLDRIAWMKAAAAKYPEMDITRVGIYGTSAGGQNSAAAMLFHPEFYKVAVSSCGCHDNRIDKWWWNEQWMGPLGPHYEAQSNITNAAKLKGNLLLMVGELDTNVPPESTFRFADALEKAKKEFELVVIPGSDHTAGGPYGERKRRDFFVKHLLGINPPNWNE